MKRYCYTILLLMICIAAKAQTPYQGGPGDGFDMASIVFELPTNIIEKSDGIGIYPSVVRSGSEIIIHGNASAGQSRGILTDVQGVSRQLEIYDGRAVLPSLPPGLYIIRIRADSVINVFRVIVIGS